MKKKSSTSAAAAASIALHSRNYSRSPYRVAPPPSLPQSSRPLTNSAGFVTQWTTRPQKRPAFRLTVPIVPGFNRRLVVCEAVSSDVAVGDCISVTAFVYHLCSFAHFQKKISCLNQKYLTSTLITGITYWVCARSSFSQRFSMLWFNAPLFLIRLWNHSYYNSSGG